MTLKSLSALGVAMALASAATASAATPPNVEGEWTQKVTCPQRGSFFTHMMRIYREGDGLKFVARAPVLAAPSDADPKFAEVYYGKADLSGDLLTLQVSPRYKRDYQSDRLRQSGQFFVQDATFRVTPEGELVALTSSVCETTPFRPVGRSASR